MAASSDRLRIAVLFGGRSAEHDVSVLSATNVMRALEPTKYDAVPVFITRQGQWLLSSFQDGTLAKPSSGAEVCLVPGGQGRMIAWPSLSGEPGCATGTCNECGGGRFTALTRSQAAIRVHKEETCRQCWPPFR